jgi:hypothetical protein
MNVKQDDPELSEAEIVRITRYHRPSLQLAILRKMGIPATMRRDNTVLVFRMHTMTPAVMSAANDRPKLKSSRK